jgi:hypothetical protein
MLVFDPDDHLVAGVEALRFFVGISARGNFGLDGCDLTFGFVVGFLFVVVEHDFRGGHVGGFDFGEGGAGGFGLPPGMKTSFSSRLICWIQLIAFSTL